jgi:hypothetical protein
MIALVLYAVVSAVTVRNIGLLLCGMTGQIVVE